MLERSRWSSMISRATGVTGLGPIRLPATALANKAPETKRILRTRMIKTSESWAWVGTILDEERIAPQQTNVLADWVRGKWGLGIKQKRGLNAEFAEETQRALRREKRPELAAGNCQIRKKRGAAYLAPKSHRVTAAHSRTTVMV